MALTGSNLNRKWQAKSCADGEFEFAGAKVSTSVAGVDPHGVAHSGTGYRGAAVGTGLGAAAGAGIGTAIGAGIGAADDDAGATAVGIGEDNGTAPLTDPPADCVPNAVAVDVAADSPANATFA